ncbi:P-loop containing nucleoside triphosphate hydrolase [Glarea lozoyensis ATCC 20868]|uniref:CTP synthase n=1 Tax=Glarea lozoyensis (strain ATCC 20868 / MF5171) TaxID=1116229 RepID=S3D7L7_GLAL2|nr:P-loop containing nucleoside triphosphate hydrolase [Glarea lozoyensis ATCC 20868]EPE28006.1 P-loop containing nucleoside triphosphate hydrolase [Glarea lozoyensis ATCC 20868]
MIKIDPYINIDAGTMAPTEHGEVFVLDDGGEVDLDLGNYERYLNITLTREHNITTGKIYQHVIQAERRGTYLGKTVQIVPDLVDAIADWIERVALIPVDETEEVPDVCVIELGGTAGDMENAPFLEALRRLRGRVEKDNWIHILVTLVPVIMNSEQKTKPTQAAMRDVLSTGLKPDLIACRCEVPLKKSTLDKVASSCDVEPTKIIAVHDVASTYLVPALLEEQGLLASISKLLRFDLIVKTPQQNEIGANMWRNWKILTSPQGGSRKSVTIALVGKYTSFMDSYMSVLKSLEHSVMACQSKLNLILVDASHLEERCVASSESDYVQAWSKVHGADGILVPGGFGERGTEGMIAAAQWARENKTPYLGICLGMQIAVIEFARHMCNIPKAGSIELSPECSNPVIIFMPEVDKTNMGGTMRLGSRPTVFQEGSDWSKVRKLYADKKVITERHRHRYEVNPDYIESLSKAGLHFIGKDEKGVRMEIIELQNHPWYVGVQFHPEYLSRVLQPSKLYIGFVAAAITNQAKPEDAKKPINGIASSIIV